MRAGSRVRIPGLAVAIGLACLAGAALVSWTRGARFGPADFAFANGAEPSTLDPHSVTGAPEMRLMRALFEGLCVLHPATLEPLPGMAESWTISADERTYTFRLRADSTWTNGDEVTAFDFAYGFEQLLDPRNAAEYAYLLFPVRGARDFATDVAPDGTPRRAFESVGILAPDARTFVVELDRPVPWFLHLAAYPPLAPVNRRALLERRLAAPDTWRRERNRPEHCVSNGPWRLAERRINDRIRLVKHPGYWDADHVAFESLDVLASEKLVTNLNLYLTGAVGFSNEVPATLVPALRGRPDFVPAPFLATCFYRVNVTRPPLDDPRVRRALALAIDREALTRRVTRAGEVPARSFVPTSIASVARYEPPDFRGEARGTRPFAEDVARARELLAEAGYGPGGRAMRPIEIHYNTQSTNKDVAEVVAHGWKTHLGVATRLVNQEKKVALDTQRRLEYDVSRSTWIADYPDPSTFLDVFTSQSENNRTGFRDPRYDAALARARDATGSERNRLYREAEEILLETLPILPLYEFTVTSVVSPRLDGYFPNVLDVHFPKFWRWRAPAEDGR